MGDKTGIEWTNATWNPTRGCSKASAECNNCYAMGIAHRFSAPGKPYEGLTRVIDGHGQWNGKIMLVPEALTIPLWWDKPRKIFVDSMSDLFHPGIPFEYIAAVFSVMASCPHHTFQILTKRPERAVEFVAWLTAKSAGANQRYHDGPMRVGREAREALRASGGPSLDEPSHPTEIVRALYDIGAEVVNADAPTKRGWRGLPECHWRQWPLKNVWIGVSVGDQQTADARREALRTIPAAVRFVSYEPAIGQVDWSGWDFLDWAISGGESGARARPSHPAWHLALRDFCQANSIYYFFKQWGAWAPPQEAQTDSPQWRRLAGDQADPGNVYIFPDGTGVGRVGKKAAGRQLDGRTHDEMPEATTPQHGS